MKKNCLLIMLILFVLIGVCGCKKNNKEEINDNSQVVDVEGATVNEEENEKKEEDVDNDTLKSEDVENKKEQNAEVTNNASEKKDVNNTNSATNKNNENNKSDTQSSNNANNSNNNNNSSDKSSTNNTKTETKPEDTDEVNALRNSIQNTYGVTIKYGDEIGNYHPKGLTPIRMTDKNEIKTYLNYTKNELAKYPNGFFKEMKNFDMPLTIYLVSSVPNNSFAGFTDREIMNNIRITVAKAYDFSYTLNHEIMHYIDAYLECKMYPNNPYTEYVALNPSGYNYGNAVSRYNFGYNGSDKEVYFMDDYAQTNVREDRAQVFRQMISRAYKLPGMFDQGTVLQKKALVIDKQIRQYYSCAKGTLTWDKFIK